MTCVAFITAPDAAHNHALVGWCLRWSARRPGRWHRVETRTGRNGVRAGIALYDAPAFCAVCSARNSRFRIVEWPEEARA